MKRIFKANEFLLENIVPTVFLSKATLLLIEGTRCFHFTLSTKQNLFYILSISFSITPLLEIIILSLFFIFLLFYLYGKFKDGNRFYKIFYATCAFFTVAAYGFLLSLHWSNIFNNHYFLGTLPIISLAIVSLKILYHTYQLLKFIYISYTYEINPAFNDEIHTVKTEYSFLDWQIRYNLLKIFIYLLLLFLLLSIIFLIPQIALVPIFYYIILICFSIFASLSSLFYEKKINDFLKEMDIIDDMYVLKTSPSPTLFSSTKTSTSEEIKNREINIKIVENDGSENIYKVESR